MACLSNLLYNISVIYCLSTLQTLELLKKLMNLQILD